MRCSDDTAEESGSENLRLYDKREKAGRSVELPNDMKFLYVYSRITINRIKKFILIINKLKL